MIPTNMQLFALPIGVGLTYAPLLYRKLLILNHHKTFSSIFECSSDSECCSSSSSATTTTSQKPKDPLQGLSEKNQGRAKRSLLAHYNGLESLVLFVGAILASTTSRTGVDLIQLKSLARVYFLSRIAYNSLYIFAPQTFTTHVARSVAGIVSLGACFRLMLAACGIVRPGRI